jgi:predicted transcriptional regulator
MSSVKEEMTRIIQEQPDDSSFDEILRELALARMIDRGLQDSDAGRTIKDDELKRQMNQWRK